MTNPLPREVGNFLKLPLEETVEAEFLLSRNIINNDTIGYVKKMVEEDIRPYYEGWDIQISELLEQFVLAPLKNAITNSKDSITVNVNLYLNQKALVLSCNDHGDYFTRKEIKYRWEQRLKPETHNQDTKEIINYHTSIQTIYIMSDLIHVDNTTGTLYVGITPKNNCLPYSS